MEQQRGHIAALAVASPACTATQPEVEAVVTKHFSGKLTSRNLSLMKSLLAHPSIAQRSFAVDALEDLVGEDPDARMDRFTKRSVELSAAAGEQALSRAKIAPAELSGLVVNTCTGYLCPGISTYLIERLGLPRTTPVYDLVGSGCGGAIPNLEIAESLARTRRGAVLSISVEICTATFQMENDISLLLSNALFADGASAVVVKMEPEGYEVVGTASRYAPEQREFIRYVYKQGRLHNKLSLKLPDLIGRAASAVIADLLACRSLAVPEIPHWAMHSGGEKIVNAVRDAIGLTEEQVLPTRRVLRERGNMSSPSVWFVMEELEKRGIAPGEWCVLLVFGAGLSAHACLLKKK